MSVPDWIYNTIGAIGVVLILSTYFLLQTGRLQSEQLRYSVLNLLGSGMILFSLFFEFNLPSFIVEAAWVTISAVGIFRWFWKRKKAQAAS
jgi:hypothetical protein